MRKLLLALLGVFVLLIAALLVGPSFFNWNAYKPQIATAVKDALGREMRVVGDIQLSILPIPALSVQRVSLENVKGADNREMVAFDEVEVKIDVSALLQGKIAVKSVRLVRPVIALEITKDGDASWDIKLPSAANETAPSSGLAPQPASSGTGGFAVDISLESLKIENATITYVDARSGLSERITGLSTEIAAESLNGPFRAEGQATARGIPIGFRLAVGQISPNHPLPVRLNIEHREAAAELTFNGTLSALTPDATLAGDLSMKAPNVATVAEKVSGATLPALLAKPLEMEAEVAASATSVGINKLSLLLGDMSFAGAVHGTLKPEMEVDLVLSASKVDLDSLLAPTQAKKTEPAASSGASGKVETKIAQAPVQSPATFALPKTISATFDLSIEAVTYKGGVIRNAAVRGGLRGGVLTLEQLGANLPGSSDFSVTGKLSAVDGQPQFDGDIAATSDSVRGLAQWLGVNPADLPADRLRNFSYTSKLLGTPQKAEIANIAMQLDASRITGGMAVELRQKPGIGLRLAVDKLNLDAYLPKPATSKAASSNPSGTPGKPAGSAEAPSPTDPTGATAALADFLEKLDANIELTAGEISIKGETARTFKLSLTIFDDKLTISEASVAEFAGIGASIAGVLEGVRTKPAVGLDYALVVRDAGRLARFLKTKLPLPANRLGKVSSNGRVDASLSQVRINADLEAMGSTANIDGTIDNFILDPALNMGVRFSHPELAVFIQKFAPDYRPAARKLGALSTAFRLQGTANALNISKLDLKAGPVTVTGNANVTRPAGKTKVDVNIKTSEILADLFLPKSAPAARRKSGRQSRGSASGNSGSRVSGPAQRWSDDPILLPIPVALDAVAKIEMLALTKGEITLDRPRIHAVLQAGKLAIQSFSAGLFEGKISAQAAIQPSGKSASVAAQLTVENIQTRMAVKTLTGHDRVQGPLSLTANIATKGHSERSLIAALNGSATLSGQAQIRLTKNERSKIGIASAGGAILSSLLGGKIRELQSLSPITQLLTSLDQAFGRNPAAVAGDLSITNGVAKTDNLTLTGQGNVARTIATIDLPRWHLNSATSLIDDPKQEPLVTFDAVGPIDAPSRTKIGGRLLKQGSQQVQEKAANPIQKILPGLLGGGRQESSGSQEQKINPGKLLEGIFNKLGR